MPDTRPTSSAYKKIMWLTTNDEDLFGNNAEFRSQRLLQKPRFSFSIYDTTGATPVGDNMNLSDPNLGVRYST